MNVIITGVNSHDPVFTQLSYSVRIPDIIPTGQFVIKVIANDSDSGNDGRVSYNLQSSDRPGKQPILLFILYFDIKSLNASRLDHVY